MFNLEIMGDNGESICYWFISSHQDEGWVYFGTIIEGYTAVGVKDSGGAISMNKFLLVRKLLSER
jgi:hypothetical protein